MDEMQKLSVQPNLVTWNGVVARFNHCGLYPEAVITLQRMLSHGFKLDWLFHNYVTKEALWCDKCACSLDLSNVFDKKNQTEVGVCSAYLSGLARNGLADDALTIFRKIKNRQVEFNVVSWTSMITCCSQNGKRRCGYIAALMNGKAAHSLSLRSATTNNVYVAMGNCKEALEIFHLMQKCGQKGDHFSFACILSACRIENKVHMQLRGGTSQPQMSEIIEDLNDFKMELEKSEYHPITQFVLQDIKEGDKEQMLFGHSEKLPVVFGFLNTTHGATLQVIKNPRICGDCHMIMEFISKLKG
uniref:DYW domain-containing protein n=1 Tax=Kalanchoe fedtschenkoi TaxID=63787 RepID=A0A7N0T082_KALFE